MCCGTSRAQRNASEAGAPSTNRRSRVPARTLTPRDRRRHRGLARNRPRDPRCPRIAIPGDDAWDAGWAQLLAGRHVSIVFDCDQAERDATARIAANLKAARRGSVTEARIGPAVGANWLRSPLTRRREWPGHYDWREGASNRGARARTGVAPGVRAGGWSPHPQQCHAPVSTFTERGRIAIAVRVRVRSRRRDRNATRRRCARLLLALGGELPGWAQREARPCSRHTTARSYVRGGGDVPRGAR